ncbi:hypothetical protein V6N11_044768 [Hibiscus sabdariffa]|uniref:Uncharacterized protein n=2 Tax=Hibiscus sabdariffa TaxID=183260 RepID=A0ABR2PTW7_9ROSI
MAAALSMLGRQKRGWGRTGCSPVKNDCPRGGLLHCSLIGDNLPLGWLLKGEVLGSRNAKLINNLSGAGRSTESLGRQKRGWGWTGCSPVKNDCPRGGL